MEIKIFNIIIFFSFFIISCSTLSESNLNKASSISNRNALKVVSRFKKSKYKVISSVDCYETIKNERNCLTFFETDDKIIYFTDTLLNTKSKYFPSEYFEYKNRIYLLCNSKRLISKEIINKLKEYNYIEKYDEKYLRSDKYKSPLDGNPRIKKIYLN